MWLISPSGIQVQQAEKNRAMQEVNELEQKKMPLDVNQQSKDGEASSDSESDAESSVSSEESILKAKDAQAKQKKEAILEEKEQDSTGDVEMPEAEAAEPKSTDRKTGKKSKKSKKAKACST
jgi:hypothetical protein